MREIEGKGDRLDGMRKVMGETSQTCDQILKMLLEGTNLKLEEKVQQLRLEVQQLRSVIVRLEQLQQRSSTCIFYFQ